MTARALLQRINRALRPDEQLRVARSERLALEFGWYYVINFPLGIVTNRDVTLEDLGRELDVLKPFEALAEEDGRTKP